MNEDEQVLKLPVNESPAEDTCKSGSLINSETYKKDNGDGSGTQLTVRDQNPGVITVPPDIVVEATKDCTNNNNEQSELVVETPDGQERRFIFNQPLNTLDIRKILHQVCRSVGINETMEAVIPEYLDTNHSSPEENKTEESENQEVHTNGLSSDKEKKGENEKKKKCQRKHKKFEEPVCLTISSDEEDNGSNKKHSLQNGLDSDEKVTTEVRKKEPNITEETESPEEAITRGVAGGGMDFSELLDSPDFEKALLQCRTVRIGSYKVVPEEKIVLSEYGIKMKVPSPKGELVTIKILRNEIVKILVHFGKYMPVLFYYTTNRAGIKVRKILKMPPKVDSIYFDPISKVEMHKRIILFPDKIPEETRLFIKSIYDSQCLLEEINSQEADDILLRVAAKELVQPPKKDSVQNQSAITPSNIQTIMVYPPPPLKGGISINTEDYACLGEDQFLNDVIIDFYLKYIVQTSLSQHDQERTHVFSSFFYKRLTTKCSPHGGANKYQDDPKLSPAEKRHARVKGWTKSVDLFSKDFIIIPINENSHWFLGIICFPGLTTAARFSDNTAVPIPVRRKRKGNMTVLTGGQAPATIGATTITMVQTVPEPTITLEGDDEDRDEAEGDDADLEPSTSDEESCKDPSEELMDEATYKLPKSSAPPKTAVAADNEPIKQPCILIFDSLAGASRSRVCATLREYLEVEYKVKNKGQKRDFSKDTLRGAVPKVPQQTNYTDCGLYVLQYVETFFQKPITNYRMPIKMLKDWFTPDIVSRKRYEIQQLLHQLMKEQNVDIARLNLPNLGLHPDGTTSHLPYSDEGDDEEYEEEEEAEMEGELDETMEDEMNMEEEMEMDIAEGVEGHSEEDEEVMGTGNSGVAGGVVSSGTGGNVVSRGISSSHNSSISERSSNSSKNEYFLDKGNYHQFSRQNENSSSTIPCKIDAIKIEQSSSPSLTTCKIEPLNIITEGGVHLKRKITSVTSNPSTPSQVTSSPTTTLKEIRNTSRLVGRHPQIPDNSKKVRYE